MRHKPLNVHFEKVSFFHCNGQHNYTQLSRSSFNNGVFEEVLWPATILVFMANGYDDGPPLPPTCCEIIPACFLPNEEAGPPLRKEFTAPNSNIKEECLSVG